MLFTIFIGKPGSNRSVHGLLSSYVTKQNSALLNFVPELLRPLLFVQSVPVTEKLLRRLENSIKDGFEEMLQPGRNGIKSKFPFGTLRPEKQLSHNGI